MTVFTQNSHHLLCPKAGALPAPASAGSGRHPGPGGQGPPGPGGLRPPRAGPRQTGLQPSQLSGVVIQSGGRVRLCSPAGCSRQTPLPKGFPGQEHWGGLPFCSAGHLPKPGVEPAPPALQKGSFPLSPQGMPLAEQNRAWHSPGQAPGAVGTAASPQDPPSTCAVRVFLDPVPARHRYQTADTGAPTGRRLTSISRAAAGRPPRPTGAGA